MALSNAERQAAFRARRLRSGMDEVRMWLRKETAKRLATFQREQGLADQDATLTRLLDAAQTGADVEAIMAQAADPAVPPGVPLQFDFDVRQEGQLAQFARAASRLSINPDLTVEAVITGSAASLTITRKES